MQGGWGGQRSYEDLLVGEVDLSENLRSTDDRQVRVMKGRDRCVDRFYQYDGQMEGEGVGKHRVDVAEREVVKIRKDEMRKKSMKSAKTDGPDNIAVEVWKSLGEETVEFLTV